MSNVINLAEYRRKRNIPNNDLAIQRRKLEILSEFVPAGLFVAAFGVGVFYKSFWAGFGFFAATFISFVIWLLKKEGKL